MQKLEGKPAFYSLESLDSTFSAGCIIEYVLEGIQEGTVSGHWKAKIFLF